MRGWKIGMGFLAVGILFGVISCTSTINPPSQFSKVTLGLSDVQYGVIFVYALTDSRAIPLAVIFDPEGGAKLSILEITELKVMAEDLGNTGRQDLVALLDRMKKRDFGGRPFEYLKKFSSWSLLPITRYGAVIGQVMTVDPLLRFEVRTGTSGRVHLILLRPDPTFVNEIYDG